MDLIISGYDSTRAARKKGVQVRLYSRPGNDLIYRFLTPRSVPSRSIANTATLSLYAAFLL